MTTIFKRYFYYWKCLINTWCLLYIMPCTPDILLYWVKIQYTFTTNVSKWKKSKCTYMYYPQPFILLFFLFFFQHLRDKFWNFLFYKFIFIFGVMNVQTLEEVVSWVAWFTILGFFTLLTQLSKDRFEYVSG